MPVHNIKRTTLNVEHSDVVHFMLCLIGVNQKVLKIRYFCIKDLKMGIQSEKLKLIQLLINTENQSIIEQVKEIFQTSNEQDFWLDLTAAQQTEINNSIEESLNGQTIDYDKFMSQHR